MTAVYRRELGGYYNTMFGYVMGAALLLIEGICVWLVNISGAYTEFHYTLDYLGLVLLLAVPVLTMRIFAEERKQKTDVLLYSLPLKSGQIVMGKYFAAMTVVLIPMLLIMIYPLILAAFGAVDYATAYSSLCAFILLTGALVSIGMFISSLTDSQGVAAGICVAVMLLLYFMDAIASYVSSTAGASLAAFIVASLLLGGIVWLVTRNVTFSCVIGVLLCTAAIVCYSFMGSSFAGLFPQVIEELSLFDRLSGFIDGLFDVRSVVYMLSVTAVFLFLTVQSVEKRRWS